MNRVFAGLFLSLVPAYAMEASSTCRSIGIGAWCAMMGRSPIHIVVGMRQ
jgi:hypothetical protein